MKKNTGDNFSNIYNRSTLNLMLFASLVIIASIIITGVISYNTSKNSVVEKLKTSDLNYILKSIRVEIDSRIQRAEETSLLIADDPILHAWFKSEEKNKEYARFVQERIDYFQTSFDYSNVFMANNYTLSYWSDGKLIDVLNEKDEYDRWYFETIKSKQKINLIIDYNKELNDTFLWVNTLMGDSENPIGIAGVGMNLKDIAAEFKKYEVGQNSNLWLIDKEGNISLTEDIEHGGNNISEYIPQQIKEEILHSSANTTDQSGVREYIDSSGKIIDLIYQPLQYSDWTLVFQVPRDDVVSILNTMKMNTILTIVIAIIAIIFIFYLVSSRISNPYKRALIVNMELERIVEERTDELTEKNNKLLDSIDYAKKIQETLLPTPEEFKEIFADYFIIWRPRDIVGGDLYWVKRYKEGYLLVIADCTGHGVPGALMTMALNSILNNIISSVETNDPVIIIKQLDKLLREHLNKDLDGRLTDDGLEAGICYIDSDNNVTFAGVGIDLYIKDKGNLKVVKGISKGIGYKKSKLEKLNNHLIENTTEAVFYLTTDGYLDQNGGIKDFSLGRKQFLQALRKAGELPLSDQEKELTQYLENYMGRELQRDDITLLGFKLKHR